MQRLSKIDGLVNRTCVLEKLHSTSSHVEMVPLFACKYSPECCCPLLGLADEDGYMTLVKSDTTASNPSPVIKKWRAHKNALFDFCWVSKKPQQIVTVSGDHCGVLWDVTTATSLLTLQGHTSTVRAVSACPDGSCHIVTGSRDGSVRIWDLRCKRPSTTSGSTILNAHFINKMNTKSPLLRSKGKRNSLLSPSARDSAKSVTAVLFLDSNRVVSSSDSEGTLRLWDIRKIKSTSSVLPSPVDSFTHSSTSGRTNGWCSLVTDANRSSLFGACTDSVIYQFSLSNLSPKPVSTYHGARLKSFYIKLDTSPCGQFLLSGSSDSRAYIWNITYHERKKPVVYLEAHHEEVTAVAWSPTMTEIVTCGDDCAWRIWSAVQAIDVDNSSHNTVHATRYPADLCRQLHFNADVKPSSQSSLKSSSSCQKSPVKSAHNSGDHVLRSNASPYNLRSLKSPCRPEATSKRRLSFSGEAEENKKLTPFHYRTPTFNLPNLVEQRALTSPCTTNISQEKTQEICASAEIMPPQPKKVNNTASPRQQPKQQTRALRSSRSRTKCNTKAATQDTKKMSILKYVRKLPSSSCPY